MANFDQTNQTVKSQINCGSLTELKSSGKRFEKDFTIDGHPILDTVTGNYYSAKDKPELIALMNGLIDRESFLLAVEKEMSDSVNPIFIPHVAGVFAVIRNKIERGEM